MKPYRSVLWKDVKHFGEYFVLTSAVWFWLSYWLPFTQGAALQFLTFYVVGYHLMSVVFWLYDRRKFRRRQSGKL